MKNTVLVCAMLLVNVGVAGAEIHPQAPRPHEQSNVVMAHYPTGSEAVYSFPRRALDENRSGRALIGCDWNEAGRLKNCQVVSETPRGYGFGKATVKVLETFGRVDVEATKKLPEVPEQAQFRFDWLLGTYPIYE